MKVLALVGPSGCGKTTLMEALVAELAGRGFRVATLKHTHHRLQDRPGSDSERHRRAGAALSLLAGPAGFSWWGEEPDPEWLVEQALRECDLVLVEGYKQGPFPRLEVGGPTLQELWGVYQGERRSGVDWYGSVAEVAEALTAGEKPRRRACRPSAPPGDLAP